MSTPMSTAEKFLVIGGQSFLGAWIARALLADGMPFVIFDRNPQNSILSQVIDPDRLISIPRLFASLSDPRALSRAIKDHAVTRVIYLLGHHAAAGQRAAPGRTAAIEAARSADGTVESFVYEWDGADGPAAGIDGAGTSVGLFAPAAYGVGSEGGEAGSITRAIRSAALARRFTIPFTGAAAVAYAEDAARAFIACSRGQPGTSRTLRLSAQPLSVEDLVREIETVVPESRGLITCEGEARSVPVDLERSLDDLLAEAGMSPTPPEESVRRTAELYRILADEGRLPE